MLIIIIYSGLYDPRLGPTDQTLPCPTCNLSYVNCPGHPGHIELDVPVYHPLLFSSMFLILRSKCAFCHKLRLSQQKVRHYLVKLKLIEMGDTDSAEFLDDLAVADVLFDSDERSQESELENAFKTHEKRYNAFCKSKNRKSIDSSCRKSQRAIIDMFQRATLGVKTCENCGAVSPTYRKDGYTKIFQRPVPQRIRKSHAAKRLKLKSALETENNLDEDNDSDDYSTDEGTNTGGGGDDDKDKIVEADKYLVPLEVEAQIRLVWKQNKDILDYIWGRALSIDQREEVWQMFFIKVVLVPPSRFRPAAKIGDQSSEHPQNIHLSKIIEASEKIKTLQHQQLRAKELSIMEEESIDKMSAEDAIVEINSEGIVTKVNVNTTSKLVTLWIDLQNSVNCFMDSAKDPNPLGSANAPSGIRQLLERKEGLFRRHMMGKRVNYCCRSVISPDVMIGSNEIGIPVSFAKSLHYPTPVNDWNVKYLRQLVENGPHKYPGRYLILIYFLSYIFIHLCLITNYIIAIKLNDRKKYLIFYHT